MPSIVRRLIAPIALAVPLAGLLLAPQVAEANGSASVAACGDIHIEAEAQCTMELEGGCEIMCEPIALTASCSAELRVGCEATCQPLEFEAQCAVDCQAACMGECDVDPGNFDCEASCGANCSANCSASCEAEASGSEARAECEASCEASCDVDCGASCEGTPPSAECSGKCEASCEGECYAEVRGGCYVECQRDGYIDCKADLQGGCEAECQKPEGALFCDGQWIDHGNNLDECVAALQALFEIMVDGYAYAECDGNTCEAGAGGSIACNCSATTDVSQNRQGGALALLLGIGLISARRRRRA
ncbi:MAG: hypothetical protein H6713_01695 [Myxococcales bacterium]|nr:hypothetical protein [Myxococcales bacterium]MCB9748697.1 hypothetical protein [Myxococcales bacterium]